MEAQQTKEPFTEANTIICPWCYGVIIAGKDENLHCPICSREFTEEDLTND